jgi:hypothetical protein
MPNLIWIAVAFALLCSSGARAEEVTPSGAPHRQPAEICEAFSWDVPVEQSFTPESVLRWREHGDSRAVLHAQHRRAGGQVHSIRRTLTGRQISYGFPMPAAGGANRNYMSPR